MILASHGIIASSGVLPPSTLLTNLYAVYKGESNANDSLGAYNGTAIGGLTYSSGKSGNAFDLNGTNAYVSLPNNSFSFANDFSYSCWVYFRDVPAGERYIITATNGNATNSDFGVSFGIYGGKIIFSVYNNANSSVWRGNSSLSTNTWYHIAVSKTLSTAPKFYLNGTLDTTSLFSGTNTLNPAYTSGIYINSLCTIGAYRYNNGLNTYAYSNALIDEVNIYNKELTASEITELQTKYYPFLL